MSSNCPAALVHGSIDILATVAATGVNNVSRETFKLHSLQVAYVHVTSYFFVREFGREGSERSLGFKPLATTRPGESIYFQAILGCSCYGFSMYR